jgi:release factor glutamine methyltransferase
LTAADTAKKTWTILELISWGTTYLAEKGFDDTRLTIELILSSVLNLQRIQLYTQFDRPLTDEELLRFKGLLKRRLTHEPVQYILGETEFMGLKFSVDSRVLIPRPDTEILVASVVQTVREQFTPVEQISILDIGTGSGCIAVSLAVMMHNASIVAIDLSQEILNLARANAERNGVSDRIEFRCHNFLQEELKGRFHCIVSNPPYISHSEYSILPEEVKDFEPKHALSDDSDGLTFYKSIAEQSSSVLCENGIIAVEHAFNQSQDVQRIFQEHQLRTVAAIKDYGGNDRAVIVKK